MSDRNVRKKDWTFFIGDSEEEENWRKKENENSEPVIIFKSKTQENSSSKRNIDPGKSNLKQILVFLSKKSLGPPEEKKKKKLCITAELGPLWQQQIKGVSFLTKLALFGLTEMEHRLRFFAFFQRGQEAKVSLAIVLVCTPQEVRLKHHRPLKFFFSQNQSIKAGSGSFIFRYAGNKANIQGTWRIKKIWHKGRRQISSNIP